MKRKSIQIGRWNGSWKWNYSWRWIKGQKSRTGFRIHPAFEGWQTPLFQKLPKNRWFKQYFKLQKKYISVNIGRLEADERIVSGMQITPSVLQEFWYSKPNEQVKILWTWDLTKKLSFSWFIYSSSARKKIEQAGWSINE